MIKKLKQLWYDPTPDDQFNLTLILVGLALIQLGLSVVLL